MCVLSETNQTQDFLLFLFCFVFFSFFVCLFFFFLLSHKEQGGIVLCSGELNEVLATAEDLFSFLLLEMKLLLFCCGPKLVCTQQMFCWRNF